MPASIEEYVQETGRAARGAAEGKGPKFGTAVLLTMPRDCLIHQTFIKRAAPRIEQVDRIWSQIDTGIHAYDPEELAKRGNDDDPESVSTVLAVHYLQEVGAVRRRPDTIWQGRIALVGDTERMVDELEVENPGLAQRAKIIMGLVERQDSDEYHAQIWAQKLDRNPWDVAADLLELNRRDILGFTVWKHAWVLEPLSDVPPSWAVIDQLADERRRLAAEKSDKAKRLSRSSNRCRRQKMLEYLGAEAQESCDQCDVCASLPRPWTDSHLTREGLLESLSVNTIIEELVEDTAGDRFSRKRIVRTLAGESEQFEPREFLAKHPAFGRLAFLGQEGIEDAINTLIDNETLDEQWGQVEQTSYSYLTMPKQD